MDQRKPAEKVASNQAPELPAVKTTIVGGRPPGVGKGLGNIPRGIEVLVKKAAVDPQFKTVLLERRAAAAESIGLALAPAEILMLNAVPAEQLLAIIARTRVNDSDKPAFLGKAAAAMLLALGVATVISEGQEPLSRGIRPTNLPPTTQTQPASKPTTASAPAIASALITQLGADAYTDRQAAQDALEKMGLAVLPALEQARQDTGLSTEARYRAGILVERIRSTTQPVRPDNITARRGARAID